MELSQIEFWHTLAMELDTLLHKGASIKDVPGQGGGGVSPKGTK